LQVFRGQGPAAVRTDLHQLARALDGHQAGAVIDALAPTLAPTPAAFGALRGQLTDDLSQLVKSASRTTQALARYQASLQTLIGGAQQTFRATADESAPLAAALQTAPATLDATVSVSHAIDQTLPNLDALVSQLEPGARLLAPAAAAALPAVNELQNVLDRARPVLTVLRPAIAQLSAASGPGRKLVQALSPTVNRLDDKLIPYLQRPDSDLKRPLYQLLGPTLGTLASAASEYDGHAHVIHFPIQPSSGSLTIVPCALFVAAPTPSQLVQCNGLNALLRTLLGGTG
jgi:ABC-type transporter Mla subunit MlaD